MKHSIKFGLMGGMILFCLSMSLTSCEDILGEWSRPTPNPVTPGGGGSSTIAVTGVKLNEAYLRFDKNVLTAQTLIADVLPADATDKTVTWTSSDPTVATVDASGNVTPVAKGKATITATSGDLSATSTVYVYDKIWNINTDGAANVAGGEFWLIEGNGSEIGNAITINASSTTTVTTVTLNGIKITNQITCSGDANIILADGSTNTVTVSTNTKAGIKIGGDGTTLTINAETAGTGTLTVQGGTRGAGIGTDCVTDNILSGGNIVINGGTVTATGGNYGAGIGTGRSECSPSGSSNNTCGNITINGGMVTATGGNYGAGIGTGLSIGPSASNGCGNIAIGTGVTSVTATKGTGSPNSIGKGDAESGDTQNCGTITFGTAAVFDGSAWSPATMVAGTYGGLNLAISTTTNADDTWTLTPVAP